MAEIFGIVTAAIGLVSPFVDQVEQFVERFEAVVDNPASVNQLAQDCSEVRSLLCKLHAELSDPDRKRRAADDFDRFRSVIEDAKARFTTAKHDLDQLEREFPTASTSSHSEPIRRMWRKGKHFVLANKFCRKIDTISKNVDMAKQSLGPLRYHLEAYVTVKETSSVAKEIKSVAKETNIVAKETLDTVKHGASASASASADAPADKFQPRFLVPAMLPTIVHDFCARDEHGEPVTMEGKLKKTLLCLDNRQNDSAAVAVAVGAAGMGGVGKTSALIGLGWEDDLRDRFKEGGVYFVSIGKDASEADIIKKLGRIVRSTGGIQCATRVLESESLEVAVEEVAQWFEGRCSLFLFDDLWETEDSTVGYFPHMRQVLSSCKRSRMVMSARSNKIALEGGERVKFKAREPNGEESRRILLEYAGVHMNEVDEMPKASKEAMERVLSKCGGVPLTLGVAGRTIREMTDFAKDYAEAMILYARDLEAGMSSVGSDRIGMYAFEDTIRTSLCVADRWSDECELRRRTGERTSCSELFTGLCVLGRQTRVPREMLKRLWRVTEDGVIHEVVKKFVDLNLISERRSIDGRSMIEAHDLILEYCQGVAGSEVPAYHARLLSEYLPNDGEMSPEGVTERSDELGLTQAVGMWCRPWWDLGSDPYVCEHICGHLAEAGGVSELVALMSDFRWTDMRVRSGELLKWNEDFKFAISGLVNWKEGVSGTQEGLEKIRDAGHDGWGLSANNRGELAFQMQSRLCEEVTRSWVVGRYVKSILRYAKKPWLKCRERCWPEPGTAQSWVLNVTGWVGRVKLAKQDRIGVVVCRKRVLIISMETRCIIRSLLHESEVGNVAVTPDGSRIVSRSYDGTVHVWDGTSGEMMFEPLRGHKSGVTCVAVSRDGSRIVSGSRDGTVRIWDRISREAMFEPPRGQEHSVTCVGLSGDGSRIVSGSSDGTVRIWDGISGEAVGEWLHGDEDGVDCVALSGDGSRIVSKSQGGAVRIWDGISGEAVCEPLRGHEDWVNCVALSGDGSRVVSGSHDGTVLVWDGISGGAVFEPLRGHEDCVTCVAVSSDGSRIVSGSRDGTVRVWDGISGEAMCEPLRGHDSKVLCLVLSGDGSRIVSGSRDGTLRVWDGISGEAVCEPLRGHESKVLCLVLSGDGSRIVSESDDGTLRVWDGISGEAMCEPLRGYDSKVSCVALSGDGSRIVSGSRDGTLRIWDGISGEAVCEPLRGHESKVLCVALSGDGSRIVSGSDDGTLRVWDGISGEAVCEPLRVHEGWVPCVAVSGDGSRIVSGSHDGTLRIWDGISGEAVCEPLRGHESKVACVAVSGDGSRIVSGSCDGTVRVWDGRRGEAVCEPLRGHEDLVRCVAVSVDGSRIVSGSGDGTMRIWDWNGVSFEGTVMLEGSVIRDLGGVIEARAKNGHVRYWRRDEEAGLVEVDRFVQHQRRGGESSVCGHMEKWEVSVRGREVFVRNSEDVDSVVVATLPSKAKHDNWGLHGFQASSDGDEDSSLLGPLVVWLENGSVFSFSLVV